MCHDSWMNFEIDHGDLKITRQEDCYELHQLIINDTITNHTHQQNLIMIHVIL